MRVNEEEIKMIECCLRQVLIQKGMDVHGPSLKRNLTAALDRIRRDGLHPENVSPDTDTRLRPICDRMANKLRAGKITFDGLMHFCLCLPDESGSLPNVDRVLDALESLLLPKSPTPGGVPSVKIELSPDGEVYLIPVESAEDVDRVPEKSTSGWCESPYVLPDEQSLQQG